jgi:hypothetical protein
MSFEEVSNLFNETHSLWETVTSMDSDQLKYMSKIIAATGSKEKDPTSYYTGFIDAVNYLRNGICPTCQIEHDRNDDSRFKALISMRANQGVKELDNFAQSIKNKEAENHVAGQYL